jgi:trk system potassium uptake protein TrkA
MKIIIVGCGRAGETLAEKLNDDGNDITVIDASADKVKEVTSRLDVMGIVGNGATHAVQEEAGLDNADLFIAVTNSDELNLLCCMIAKKRGNCKTIARVKNPEYSKEENFLRDTLGMAMVINPEYAAAEEIARILRFPSALKIEPFGKGRVELVKFRIGAKSPLIGLSVKDAVIKFKTGVLFCTIERDDEAYIVNGNSVFKEKDVVSIVAAPKNAKDFFVKIRHKGHSIKDAVIVGGGDITHYLCEILEKSNISLKVIEKDNKICEELAGRFNKVHIIHGKPSDRELLLEEGVAKTSAFVALTSFDEENILHSLFAKEAGAEKLITKVDRIGYDSIVSKLGLDTVICPKNIVANLILRYVRSVNNSQGGAMENLYSIIQDKVEAAEFIVKEGFPFLSQPLSTIRFKKDVLVASIMRGEEVIIPRGYDTIEAGDSVVFVTKGLPLQDLTEVIDK